MRQRLYTLADFNACVDDVIIGRVLDENIRARVWGFLELEPDCQAVIAEQAVKLSNKVHGVSPIGCLEIIHVVGRVLEKGAMK